MIPNKQQKEKLVIDLLNQGFLRLQNLHKAATILKNYKDQLSPFVKMFEWLKGNDTRGKDIRFAIDSINNIKALDVIIIPKMSYGYLAN